MVSRDVTVTNGAVLTIGAGTVVEFGYDDTIFVRDGGRVVANGAVFRPRATPGNSAAIYVHEVGSPGSVELRNSTLEHVFVYTTGAGSNVFEGNRFTGEAGLRLFSTAASTIRSNTFESGKPIWTEITFPHSTVEGNAFAPGSVTFHPNPQRISRDDTVRTYQGLPVQIEGDVSVTAGATLVVTRGTEIRQGYFDAFLVNGRGVLKADGVHFRPAGSHGDFPAIILSTGDGPGRAEISDCVVQSLSIQFSGGTGFVSNTDFLVSRGKTALTNTVSTPVDARGNYWNGTRGPTHSANPEGNGAGVSGPVDYSPWQSAALHSVSTGTEAFTLPEETAIEEIYPNPTSDRSRIAFRTSRIEHVTIELYDATGRLVERMASGIHAPGRHEVNLHTHHFASGVYLVHLTAGSISRTARMIVTH